MCLVNQLCFICDTICGHSILGLSLNILLSVSCSSEHFHAVLVLVIV